MPKKFTIVSPVDDSVLARINYATPEHLSQTLTNAGKAAAGWKQAPLSQRVELIEAFVSQMERRRAEFARLVTLQMGRPIQQADEVGRVRQVADQLKALATKSFEPEELPGTSGIRRFTRREPLGICLSICPWNYPVAMAASLVLAPLLAGNVVLFKHAPQTALVAELMQECFEAADGPAGVFTALHLDHSTARHLIESGDIALLLFVGSVRGGKQVYAAAARGLVRTVLELGGKDPAYVRADADLQRATTDLIEGSFSNSGQSCCSVERIYVHDAVYTDFVQMFTEAARKVTVGHPLQDHPQIGPVVSAAAAERISFQIQSAVDAGARVVVGPSGKERGAEGRAYLNPTVLLDTTHSMSILREETFGPVAPIMRVSSDADAIERMNDSIYGLTASIWTADIQRAIELGSQVEAGTFYVNRCDHADIYLPISGTKASGLGKSLGPTAFDALTATKAYHVRT